MEKYNYTAAMMEDIANFIDYNDIDINETTYDSLLDMMYDADEVTGNMYGYASAYQCEKYLAGNLTLLLRALDEYESDWPCHRRTSISDRIIAMDSIIRCYLLPTCLETFLSKAHSNNLNQPTKRE